MDVCLARFRTTMTLQRCPRCGVWVMLGGDRSESCWLVVKLLTASLQGLWESQRNFSRPLISWESVYF